MVGRELFVSCTPGFGRKHAKLQSSNARKLVASSGMSKYILSYRRMASILLMDKILHYFKYPKLWELWYIPYYG